MSETYALVDQEIERLGVTEGLDASAAAMWLAAVSAMAKASALPRALRASLISACSRWFGEPTGAHPPLRQLAADCWAYLETKHGNSSSIVDREDIAIRTLLCVLDDEPPAAADLDMTIDFLVSMLDRFGGLRRVLFDVR